MNMVEQIASIDRIHQLNGAICFALGLPLNLLLIWLIAQKSTEQMRVYKGILFQLTVADLYYLVINFLF